MQGGGAVTAQVTIADLFRVMSSIQTDLARAVTKLEVIDARNVSADKTSEDHERRIRVLETSRNRWAGVSIAVGTIAGILSGILSTFHHL